MFKASSCYFAILGMQGHGKQNNWDTNNLYNVFRVFKKRNKDTNSFCKGEIFFWLSIPLLFKRVGLNLTHKGANAFTMNKVVEMIHHRLWY